MSAPAVTRHRRTTATLVLGGIAPAVVATVAAAWLTGAAAPYVLADPGALIRWGLPVIGALSDLCAALTVGVLALLAFALPSEPGKKGQAPRALAAGLQLAAVAAAGWTVTGIVTLIWRYAEISGTSFTDQGFGRQLMDFALRIDLGRSLLLTTALAALITVVAAGASRVSSAAGLLALSLVALIPAALAGHSAGSSDHETAVTSLGVHLVGVCLWVGGLAALLLLRHKIGAGLATVVARFSKMATWAFAAVALSGVINAAIRLGSLGALGTAYGAIVMLKAVALLLLGIAGWLHRRHTLPALHAQVEGVEGAGGVEGVEGSFARLAGVELAVMAVAVGLAATLARSAPPVAELPSRPLSPAELTTGYPLPPPPTWSSWLGWQTGWQPDLLWVLVVALLAGLYGAGVRRMRTRGDGWPIVRSCSWGAGLLILLWATSGPIAGYGRVLFSAHMFGHLLLSMLVPMFLVGGAPITLALRTLKPRHDGSWGPREWLLWLVASRAARLIAHPILAPVLFAGSLVGFYFSGLFELALTTHLGHELMDVHFLLVGYLFMSVLVGVDPGFRRPAPALRLVILLATMAFHAFFAIALISTTTVLAAGYFSRLGRDWGQSLLADQHLGGGLTWGIGEVPMVAMALLIAVQWARADDREARRSDRAADRDGDAQLVAYNAMLGKLADHDIG